MEKSKWSNKLERKVNTFMKSLLKHLVIIIVVMLLSMSCISTKLGSAGKIYPYEVSETTLLKGQLEEMSNVMDISRVKFYYLGGYYISQSILSGPSGRASNYYHYILSDTNFLKEVYFMSLSSEINNIWMERDTLFIDILDFVDELYDRGEYFSSDTCDFNLYHLRLLVLPFSLDTSSEEKVHLVRKDLTCFPR